MKKASIPTTERAPERERGCGERERAGSDLCCSGARGQDNQGRCVVNHLQSKKLVKMVHRLSAPGRSKSLFNTDLSMEETKHPYLHFFFLINLPVLHLMYVTVRPQLHLVHQARGGLPAGTKGGCYCPCQICDVQPWQRADFVCLISLKKSSATWLATVVGEGAGRAPPYRRKFSHKVSDLSGGPHTLDSRSG